MKKIILTVSACLFVLVYLILTHTDASFNLALRTNGFLTSGEILYQRPSLNIGSRGDAIVMRTYTRRDRTPALVRIERRRLGIWRVLETGVYHDDLGAMQIQMFSGSNAIRFGQNLDVNFEIHTIYWTDRATRRINSNFFESFPPGTGIRVNQMDNELMIHVTMYDSDVDEERFPNLSIESLLREQRIIE